MYRVQLKNFEGPLDLLLFFIKRDELDIHNIPIAYITDQFLEYIRLMEELDLDIASEFIHMASLLMAIKARMMLPRTNDNEEEIDEEDPRYELVQRLLEYKRYKEMADKMSDMEERAGGRYYRRYLDIDQVDPEPGGEALKEVTMFDLMAAYKNVLSDIKKKRAYHKVERIQVTMEDQAEYVLDTLHKRGRTTFTDLCSGLNNQMFVIVTFLAVLEMIKEQQLDLYIGDYPDDFSVDLKPVDQILTYKSEPSRN